MAASSAPGKLMVFGEHAVVYGAPCIVTAVDQPVSPAGGRLTVSIERGTGDTVRIHAPGVKDTRFVDQAIALGCKTWGLSSAGLRVTSASSFSGKYGFGSSAAVTVATLHALAVLLGKSVTKRELFDLAYRVVLDVQKVGSGFDVAAAIFGGTLFFTKGGKTLEELSLREDIPLIVGYTGIKSNSVDIVNQVAQKREKYKERVDRIMQAIGKLTGGVKESVLAADWERVGRVMDFNQEYLRDLGVSSEKLEALISAAKKSGAWGAKLSGAGGGDCMIAVAPRSKFDAIHQAITAAGGEAVRVRTGAEGVEAAGTDDQKELFVVVDKLDNVIGYRTRGECHHDTSLIHRSANVLLFDDTGKILLQKRSQTKDINPGLWTVSVTGHVAKGETYEQAARREMKEELGVDVPVKFKTKFILPYEQETEMEAVFEARYNGPFHPDTREVERVEFIDKSELPRKLLSREIVLTEFASHALKRTGFLP